eukprot:364166-Pleurochrysis_carterae.AAC.1
MHKRWRNAATPSVIGHPPKAGRQSSASSNPASSSARSLSASWRSASASAHSGPLAEPLDVEPVISSEKPQDSM